MTQRRLPTLNKVMIVGMLTKDPELRYTQNRIPVINFRIASSRRFRDSSGEWKEDVCYVGIVAWQKLAENCAEHLKKGSSVFVEGELQSHTWEKDDGSRRSVIEIHAHRVQFLDKRETSVEPDETAFGDENENENEGEASK